METSHKHKWRYMKKSNEDWCICGEVRKHEMKVFRGKKNKTITDQNDLRTADYNRGFTSGFEYQGSSRESKDLIDGLKTEVSNNKIIMENIKEIVIEGFKQNTLEHDRIRESQVKALETKADKQIVDDLKEVASKKADKDVVDEIREDIRTMVRYVIFGVLGVAGSCIIAVIKNLM